MNTSYPMSSLALLVSILLATAGYSESQTESARQQIQQAVASGNVQTVIVALPILESLWPQSMGEYFQSAEEIARVLNDAGDDPTVQQAGESLHNGVLKKRCPLDAGLDQTAAYFSGKQKVVGCYFGFDNMRYNKSHLLAVSRVLGEIRDRRIPNYDYKRSWAEVEVLNEAGVCFASDLTDPKHIAAYEEAMRQNIRDLEIHEYQRILFNADSLISFKLLHACKQLRHDGILDEEFANEVAENARLTEEEREMRYPFDKNK